MIGYNQRQIQKKIWTEKPSGNKIKVIKAMTDNEEGKRVADLIIEQKNRFNLANQDIAVLYRTNAQSRVFEEHLRRKNIPYRIYGGQSFYQRKEIKDLIAYMRLAVNAKDDEALKRIINYPRRGIGQTTMQKLTSLAEDNEVSIWDCLTMIKLSNAAQKKIGVFVGIMKYCREQATKENAYRAALNIAKKSGIIDLLKSENTIEAQNRMDNINALLDGIQEFTEDDVLDPGEDIDNQERTLANFLQTISLMTDADEEKDNVDTITLLSVHAAKGLEYRSVFVVGLEENLFPSYMSLSSPDQLDEERRLFYVAITRAEELLTLTYANSRYQYGNMRFNDSSRFLEEISENDLESSIMASKKPTFKEPKILGNFKKLGKARVKNLVAPPENFKPSDSSLIKVGQTVMHLKFGKGKVMSIDERKIATIKFLDITESPEKRIMLDFTRLQILEE